MRKALMILALALILAFSGTSLLATTALAGDNPPDGNHACLPVNNPDGTSICLNGDNPPDGN